MGRTRTVTKNQRPTTVRIEPKASSSKPEPSIHALVEKAQSLIVQCDYDMARRFVQRVLQRDPAHVEAREMLGVISLEQGDIDTAKETFLTLIPPSVNAAAPPLVAAYLYLAQLSDEDPRSALSYYQTAVDIQMSQLKSKGKERAKDADDIRGDDADMRQNVVRALVAMVEIWMDPSHDLCDDPAAEKTCQDLLDLALQTDPENAEALQALASVRLSQEKPDDAKVLLTAAFNAWKDLEEDDPRFPSILSRIAMTKLFIELHDYAPALYILNGVHAEDDQDVESWYLEGWTCYLMYEDAKQAPDGKLDGAITWQEIGQDALDCFERCQNYHAAQDHTDRPMLEHIQELMAKLRSSGITETPPEAENVAMEEGEEWENFDESESESQDAEMS